MSTTAATTTPSKPLAMSATKTTTPSKSASRYRLSHHSENSHPNIPTSPPPPPSKPSKSPATATKSASASAKKKPSAAAGAPPQPRERRFLVAKKGARRRRNGGASGGQFDFDKCREAAYEALRASQEEFFRKERATADEQQVVHKGGALVEVATAGAVARDEGKGGVLVEKKVAGEEGKGGAFEEEEEGIGEDLEGSSKVRKMRSLVLEKAMSRVPDPGSGRVKHLVQAFECMLSISGTADADDKASDGTWALPGLRPLKTDDNGAVGLPAAVSVFSSVEFLKSGEIGRGENRLCSSFDGNSDRLSWDSGISAGGRRSRQNTSESLRSSWNKKLRVTSQHPFKLRTEQRGRVKEEQFVKKVQEMLMEEEKKRIPIAQGLPWTTDEPEPLLKPPVKESTEPVDLVLHSDLRAVERAEFDQYISERFMFAEQLRLERERQQKLEEEEEIRRLRKELVPKAQPMPYFDRPFIPKKSARPRTVPKEPRFHLRPEKSSCYCRQQCVVDVGKMKGGVAL